MQVLKSNHKLRTQVLQLPLSGKLYLCPRVVAPPQERLNFLPLSVYLLGHAVLSEVLRWTDMRSPAATNEFGSTTSPQVESSVSSPPQPVAANPV